MFHFAMMRTREDRGRRILKVAVELAERGGFDAVRQREVAAQAGVALGTLYKRFASKEELLMAALELEVEKFEQRLKLRPLKGATTVDRLTSLFANALTGFVRKPNLGRATIRAATSGPLSPSFIKYHAMLVGHVVEAIDDQEAIAEVGTPLSAEKKHTFAILLLQVWFTSLVGWATGVQDPKSVARQLRLAADIMLCGLQAGAPRTAERRFPGNGGRVTSTKVRRATAG
jgi:TetR/AcrR family transcriptional regulator, cholesterol catabolism regulator